MDREFLTDEDIHGFEEDSEVAILKKRIEELEEEVEELRDKILELKSEEYGC